MHMADLRSPLRTLAIVVAALLGLAPGACAQQRFDFEATRTLLPKTVVPSHYDLALQVDPRRPHFDGQASIAVRAREPVASITLHARRLQARRVARRRPAACAARGRR
jgi:aminopeptidase N